MSRRNSSNRTSSPGRFNQRVVVTHLIFESAHLKKEIEIIQGVPQPVYKIPLEDIPKEGLARFRQSVGRGSTPTTNPSRSVFNLPFV